MNRHFLRMLNKQKLWLHQVLRGYGGTGTPVHYWWECEMYNHFEKPVGGFPIKFSIYLPYDQQSQSQAFTQEKWKPVLTQKPIKEYVYQLCSYLPKTESNPDVFQQRIDKQTGIHTYNRILLRN